MSQDVPNPYCLVPEPAETLALPGEFLPGVTARVLAGSPEALQAVRAAWPEMTRRKENLAPLTLWVGPVDHPAQPVALTPPEAAESYALRLDPGFVTLVARDEAGLFYGVQTLQQVFAQRHGGPCVEIQDWPRHHWRGYQIDLGRQMESMETLKRYIDLMARFKLSQCFLYLENAFAYAACPEACSPDALTVEQVKELDAFCRERYVELIPAPNFLGHSDWLLSHPQYRHLSETREGTAWRPHMHSDSVICTSLPETWELLAAMVDNLAGAFSSPWINVGLDETWSLASCPLCSQVRQEHGEGEVFRRHVQGLRDLLAERGKRMIMWADMPCLWPEIIPTLPRDVVMLDWYYEPVVDHVPVPYLNWQKLDVTRTLREAGFEVLAAPCDRDMATYTSARNARLWDCAGLCTTQWDMSQNMLHECTAPVIYGGDCGWARVLRTPQEARPDLAQILLGTADLEAQGLLAATTDYVRTPAGEGQGPGRFLRYRREIPEYQAAQHGAQAQTVVEACRKHPAFQEGRAASLLEYAALRVSRWRNACDSDCLVNEAGLSARAALAGRDLPEAQEDLARFAERLAAVAARQQRDVAEMTRLWEQDRPGITPVRSVLIRMQKEADRTSQYAAELAAFAAAPAPGKAPFEALRLVLELMMPEANAQRISAEVSADGESWTAVPIGGWRHAVGTGYFPQPLDCAIACDVPGDTRYVRLGSPGVGPLAARTVRLISATQERLPAAIVDTGGKIWFPEHLLADDTRFCLLNEAEVAQAFHHPETLEKSWVTVEL